MLTTLTTARAALVLTCALAQQQKTKNFSFLLKKKIHEKNLRKNRMTE